MKTYKLTRLDGETKEVKADWFDYDASNHAVLFYKTNQDAPLAAFSGVDSVEEKSE